MSNEHEEAVYELLFEINKKLGKLLEIAESRAATPDEPPPPSGYVSELGLTVRTQNCLDSENICTLAELCSMTLRDLSIVRNMGKVGLAEILSKLEAKGLHLKRGRLVR